MLKWIGTMFSCATVSLCLAVLYSFCQLIYPLLRKIAIREGTFTFETGASGSV